MSLSAISGRGFSAVPRVQVELPNLMPAVLGLGAAVYLAMSSQGKAQMHASAMKAKSEVWAEIQKSQIAFRAEQKKRRAALQDAIERVNPRAVADARFARIIGQTKAKGKFEGIVARMSNPLLFMRHLTAGETLVVPAIMDGPPGVGKTEMVRALIGELAQKRIRADFIQLHCDKLGTNGPLVLDELKKQIATSRKGSIVIFMDEIDSLGSRSSGNAQKTDTINALLTLMDGVSKVKGKNIIWLGATNHYHNLDSALLSRFMERITFNLPTSEELKKIYLQEFAAKKVFPPSDLDMDTLAKNSYLFAGRDVKAVVALLKERLMNQISRRQRKLNFTQEELMSVVNDIARKKPLHTELRDVIAARREGLPPPAAPAYEAVPTEVSVNVKMPPMHPSDAPPAYSVSEPTITTAVQHEEAPPPYSAEGEAAHAMATPLGAAMDKAPVLQEAPSPSPVSVDTRQRPKTSPFALAPEKRPVSLQPVPTKAPRLAEPKVNPFTGTGLSRRNAVLAN